MNLHNPGVRFIRKAKERGINKWNNSVRNLQDEAPQSDPKILLQVLNRTVLPQTVFNFGKSLPLPGVILKICAELT